MINCIKPLSTLAFGCLVLFNEAAAQEVPSQPIEPPEEIARQLEDMTESRDDMEPEDDSYVQELQQFLKEPINLNYADAGLLQQLIFLSPIHISNLISYRKIFGPFISLYELQAVPGWDAVLIRKLRPYITVTQKVELFNSLKSRFKNGSHSLLFRTSMVLEKSKGYLLDSSVAKNFYPGSRQKIFLRYKYVFKNSMQYGFTAEKDAGEEFFKGSQKKGFDFYSAHFFARNMGVIKSIAIGDFAVNLGQGLTQWQSLAFNKGADIVTVKRQSDVLRPYNSAGEIAFHRGAGITLKKRNWETTGFFSLRRIDAGFETAGDGKEEVVTSFHTSGYHRTANEISGKNFLGQQAFGGNVGYSDERFHAGINGVHYEFDHTIQKPDYLYNKYAISGKRAGNYSVDYSYTYKNFHFFGEAASDENSAKAFVNGLVVSTDSKVGMSFFYRNISKEYQSLYTSSFTESSTPTNESGFYSGITINPSDYWRFDAYADFFHFHWLKYRIDAPASGNDFMIQATYKPGSQTEFSSRYRIKKKPINDNPDGTPLHPVMIKSKQELRTQFSYKPDNRFTFRSRAELCWFDKKGDDFENGFLIYCDMIYKPLSNPFSGNIRFCYFETDGYNSRLYAFENDVLYAYSIPAFFDKGCRFYLNVNYDVSKKIALWAKFSRTFYPGKSSMGSGLDMISGNKKSEVKFQAIWRF